MINRLLSSVVLFLLVNQMPGMVAHADLIVNGSFENATGGLPDNWIATGNLRVVSSQGETDGVNAVAFSFGNLPSNGVLSQSFATVAGLEYALSFDFGKFSINQPLDVARLQVDIFNGTGFGGLQILNQVVSDATPATGDPDSTDSPNVYSPFQFEFVASGAISTLRFTDVSDPQSFGGGFDAMLDNVRISAVPEPSSVVLLSLSAMAMFAIRRRHCALTAS